MTVFKHPRGKTYRYDFWWHGDRHMGNTHQTSRAEAEVVENDIKKRLRLHLGGIAPPDPDASPRFQDWAEIYYDHILTRRKNDIKRPDRVQGLLRVTLRFWGQRPGPTVTGKWAAKPDDPYHDLRLIDPINDPMWLLKFEDWMSSKNVAGQTKNQYRSTLSQMYALAVQPAFRNRTGVPMNPFLGIPRDRGRERTSTVSIEELQAWLRHASYHVRLAVSIAALAPELRLANVLALKWDVHIDNELRYITVHDHKTDDASNRPLLVPIDEQLRQILEDARRRHAGKHVVVYRGKPLKSIRGGVRAAAEAAGLRWGRFDDDGVTFHTIRHTMATMLAELSDLDGQAPLSESQRKDAMGHKWLETTQRYTHIRPAAKRKALERLSKVTPIASIVMQPWMRASRAETQTIKLAGSATTRRTSGKADRSTQTRISRSGTATESTKARNSLGKSDKPRAEGDEARRRLKGGLGAQKARWEDTEVPREEQ
jgi:integrase